jgi:two-component system nitrate/nitrite response regulator NarL
MRGPLPSITVFIAGIEKRTADHCLRLLRRARDIRVVGTARTAREAVAGASLKPQIVLFDLNINKKNAVPALMLIRAKSPRTKIILLTGRASDARILDAISQGARGYLGAALLRRFLVKAVRAVNAGESWVPRSMVVKIIDRLARLNPQSLHLRRA